eukprot:sb/3472949/
MKKQEDRVLTSSALRKVFKKYAVPVDDEKTLSIPSSVYVRDFLRLDVGDDAVELFSSVADIKHKGYITLDEFLAVERIMRMPDAHFRLAFRMCDRKGSGTISVEDFMNLLTATQAYNTIKFNKNCNWMRLHFGKNLQRKMRPDEFPQFIATLLTHNHY